MKKQVQFTNVKFPPEVFEEAMRTFPETSDIRWNSMSVTRGQERWELDTKDEFYADYHKEFDRASANVQLYDGSSRSTPPHNLGHVHLEVDKFWCTVACSANTRLQIDKFFNVLEKHRTTYTVQPEEVLSAAIKPTVFIGHGHSSLWRDLKDHLHDQQGYPVESYETGARAGHAIRDILQEMLNKSSFALLLLTAEDEMKDGTFRARENVVHEAGLFQGRLGFARAIILVEEGVEPFSNIDGIQQIRFTKGNVREVYGDVLATIRREFE